MLQGISQELTAIATNGGVAAVLLWVWRQTALERKEREQTAAKEREASEARFMAILESYRGIVTANTEALQSLRDAIGKGVANCPWSEAPERRT